MITISFFILHIACLLSAIIADVSAWQHQAFDATTLDDIASSSHITPIRTLDDLEKFVRLPNAQLLENDDTTFDSTSDFDKEALFILFDTSSLSTHSSAPDPSSNAENAVTLKRTFQSFADSQRNEPLRFGIIEIENVKSAGVFEQMIKEMGIDPELGLGLGSSAPGPTVVCLRCGGVEGRVETWVVRESLVVSGSGSGSEGEGGKVRQQELSDLKRWMEEMARPVIGELTRWNYGRVRETENTLPTVYVFALSHQQRINLSRTLSALATKYHSSLQIVVVDLIMFPGVMKELGLSLDSDSEGSGSDVAAAVVWPQKSNIGNDGSKIEKLIYRYPNDRPITESNVKQWGLDLYLGRVKPWFPPSSPNDETKKEDESVSGTGSGNGNGRDEVLRDLKNRVRVMKGGKKATRRVMKRNTGSGSGSRSGSIPGVKIRVAGRDEL